MTKKQRLIRKSQLHWTDYCQSCRLTDMVFDAAITGENEYYDSKKAVILPELKKVADKGYIAVAVPKRFRVPITSSNVDMIAHHHCLMMQMDIKGAVHMQSLVQYHSTLELLLINMFEVALELIPDLILFEKFGNQKIEARHGKSRPSKALKEKVIHKYKYEYTLRDKVDMLIYLAKHSDKAMTKSISDVYKIDFDSLEDVDRRRHDYIHSLVIPKSYDSSIDKLKLDQLARYSTHLLANCFLSLKIGYLDRFQVSHGEPSLTPEKIFVGGRELLAEFRLPGNSSGPADKLLFSLDRGDHGCAEYFRTELLNELLSTLKTPDTGGD